MTNLKAYVAVAVMVCVSGCGAVSSEQIEAAKAACASHNGIKAVAPLLSNADYKTECNDGTQIFGRIKP